MGRLSSGTTRRVKASEAYRYVLNKKSDGSRSVTESYQLTTSEKPGSHPLFGADYEGTSTHSASGIPQTLSLRGYLRKAKDGQMESTAFRITYRYITNKEVTQRADSKKEYFRQIELARKINDKNQFSDRQPLPEAELLAALALIQSDSEADLVQGMTILGSSLP